MAGKVIRAEYRQHTVRAMAQHRGAIDKFLLFVRLFWHGKLALIGNGNLIDHHASLPSRRRLQRGLPVSLMTSVGLGFMRLSNRAANFSTIACRSARLSGPTRKRRARRLTGLGDLCRISVIPLPKYLRTHRIQFCGVRPDRLSVAVYPWRLRFSPQRKAYQRAWSPAHDISAHPTALR